MDKTISTNQDTITYTIKRCMQIRNNFGSINDLDTTYLYDTIQQVVTNTGEFSYMTNELLKDSTSNATFKQVTYANKKGALSKATAIIIIQLLIVGKITSFLLCQVIIG